jgi:hypothetical protein
MKRNCTAPSTPVITTTAHPGRSSIGVGMGSTARSTFQGGIGALGATQRRWRRNPADVKGFRKRPTEGEPACMQEPHEPSP